MKTDAGWKLWTRKPSAAPAMTAARIAAAPLPRSKAMIANELAAIAQTPAASPSTPSEKLTTLMISDDAEHRQRRGQRRRGRPGR